MAGRVYAKDWLEPDKLILLEGWAKDGMTMDDIAAAIKISRRTLYNWQDKHFPILHALRAGKEVADYEVSNSLHKRATGYDYTEDTYETVKMSQEEYDLIVDVELAIWNKKNKKASPEERERFILSIPRTKQILTKSVKKHQPGDVRAMMFWLANRDSKKWKAESKIEHIIQNNSTSKDPLEEMSTEDLEKLIQLADPNVGGDDDWESQKKN